MKLINSFKGDEFTDIIKAKEYYLPCQKDLAKDGYTDEEYEQYNISFHEYLTEIENSNTLEELCYVLNSYTDMFDDGSCWMIV